jgi:predicted esterase
VGARNVVLWGLSQGCAAALVAMLTWEAEPIGAVVGMCGWLPFGKGVEEIAKGQEVVDEVGGGEEDVFETHPDTIIGEDPAINAIAWLREELEMPKGQTSVTFQLVPVFLGHGVEDGKVFVDLGRDAARCLKALGVKVCWNEYEGLGHWYSKDMLNGIKDFLQQQDKF